MVLYLLLSVDPYSIFFFLWMQTEQPRWKRRYKRETLFFFPLWFVGPDLSMDFRFFCVTFMRFRFPCTLADFKMCCSIPTTWIQLKPRVRENVEQRGKLSIFFLFVPMMVNSRRTSGFVVTRVPLEFDKILKHHISVLEAFYLSSWFTTDCSSLHCTRSNSFKKRYKHTGCFSIYWLMCL